jgi:hypothetical protein
MRVSLVDSWIFTDRPYRGCTRLVIFDFLHVSGRSTGDLPAEERRALLDELGGDGLR